MDDFYINTKVNTGRDVFFDFAVPYSIRVFLILYI